MGRTTAGGPRAGCILPWGGSPVLWPVAEPHPPGLWAPWGALGCPLLERWPSLAGFSSHRESAACASPTKLGPSGVYGWQSVTSCF